MNLGNIFHRGAFNDCYAINSEEIVVNIRTGKDITKVNLIHGDPYDESKGKKAYWTAEKSEMIKVYELKHSYIYSIKLKPKFKRQQYYFEIYSNDEKKYYLEDDFYTEEELSIKGIMYQYFKFPYINSSDIYMTPQWVKDTIWYQIMPDRFNKGSNILKSKNLKEWKYEDSMSFYDFYGGDIKGIEMKLEYLKDLGISGIYLNPIMDSPSCHKYSVRDYYKIDGDFGNDKDMKRLVEKAHKLGIRVMVDAVLNHSSEEFPFWKDVLEKGKESKYFNWFFVNELPVNKDIKDTRNGEYESFSYDKKMPRLNTIYEEVINYFIDVLKYWVETWDIDGIRFDVGDEISHNFIKRIRSELKKVKKDLFLLGEVWQDSVQFLQGDEYDSVMNYPFVDSINNFWIDEKSTARDLMMAVNRCYSMYKEPVNKVLFNLLDSHDIGRVFSRCRENLDVFFQELCFLLTMEGSPSIYYGTEIAMTGDRDPLNRKCMPWEDIEKGKYDDIINDVKKLIYIRNTYSQCKGERINWLNTSSRLIHYQKLAKGVDEKIGVLMNCEGKDLKVGDISNVLFSKKYNEHILEAGGLVIYLIK